MISPGRYRHWPRAVITGAGLLFIGVTAPDHLIAQEIDPNVCFCLRHETGQFRRGCTAFKGPQDFYTTAICTDPETAKSTEGLITKAWEMVKDGGPGCEVCRPQLRSTNNLPRGEGDEKERSPE